MPYPPLSCRLDFLEGLLGFDLGVGRALEGLCKLRRLRLVVMLQGAELLAELLELLLYPLVEKGSNVKHNSAGWNFSRH